MRLSRTASRILLLSVLIFSSFLLAAEEPPAPTPAVTPLIPRELFFDDPKIAGSQLSPDGRFHSFVKPWKGVMNIWVKALDEPMEAARPVTDDTKRPVTAYFWSEDGRYILYVQDKGGNENYHVYAVDPKAGTAGKVPRARDLTPIDGVVAYIYAVPEGKPAEILVGLNDRDRAYHDVYRLNLATGKRKLLIKNDKQVGGWVADLQGEVRLAVRQTESGGTEILKVAGGALGEPVYTCGEDETCGPLRFHKDGRRVYIQTNKGKDVDLIRLMLLDVETGETTLVDSDPEGEVDFGDAIFSDATEELIGTAYAGDRVRIYPKAETLRRWLEAARKDLPDGELGLASATEDDRYLLVSVSRDVDPGTLYLFDTGKMTFRKLYASRPELPSEQLAPMKPVRYPARDGLVIPAYLTVPKGAEPRNLPTVVLPHGGPWHRDSWGYDPFAQFLANRGYAVLQPNFRGSTGYGKKFLNAGNGQWGTGAMQHDLTDAVGWLVGQGIADPKRVAILGGSYGGFATLAGVTFTPDLYAAGVDIVGPSNIVSLLESFPPYWRSRMKVWYVRVGDPSNPEERKRLESQSPLFFADRIQAPLLVIQGANDPRVTKPESDRIVVALRDRGRPVEYLVAPDEGHGFAGRENRLAMFAAIERFLARHLGGRYQPGMAPEMAERLKVLTVDPAGVKLPAGTAEAAGGK